MDSRSIDRIKHALNTDVIRRLLIKYFQSKGFNESFDRLLYPALMQDVGLAVPQLANRLEVVPYAAEVDPWQSSATLGWNLFVLGNHRMFLGETYHRDLMELARQLQQGQIQIAEGQTSTGRKLCTPRQVVNFVTRVLGRHERGYVDLTPPATPQPFGGGRSMAGPGSSQFYSRSGYGT